MKSYSWILILVLFLSGFSSCHSDAERYKDILREGSWYVYDIDYSYKLYDDFEKKAGIEDISLKNELFDVVFAHAVEYERQGFEQGFKLGMKTAIAALSEPDTD